MIADEIISAGFNCFLTTIIKVEELLQEKKLEPSNTTIHTRTAHPGQVYRILKKLEDKGYRVYNNPETTKLPVKSIYLASRWKSMTCLAQ